jgi:hypothetical protein
MVGLTLILLIVLEAIVISKVCGSVWRKVPILICNRFSWRSSSTDHMCVSRIWLWFQSLLALLSPRCSSSFSLVFKYSVLVSTSFSRDTPVS